MSNRQLTILLIIILVAGIGLGVRILQTEPDRIEEQFVEQFKVQQETLAEQAAMRIGDSLREVRIRLATAANQPWAAPGKTPTTDQLTEGLVRLSHHSDARRGITLSVFNKQGEVLATAPGADADQVAKLVAQIDSVEPVLSDGVVAIYRRGLVEPETALAVVHLDARHALAARVDLDRIAGRIFEQVLGPRDAYAAVLDANGETIYVSDTARQPTQTNWVIGSAAVPGTKIVVEAGAPRATIVPELDERVRVVIFRSFTMLALFGASVGIVFVLLRRQQRTRVAQMRVLAHQDKLATLGMMAASTAHEIRNAITVADLQLQLAGSEADPETLRHIEKASESVDRLAGLASSLSRFGGKDQQVDERFALSSAVEEALRVVQPKTDRNLDLEVHTADELFVFGSQAAIVQVIVNLVLNAFDALQSQEGGGRVDIRTCRDGDDAVLWVTDNGEGIVPDVLDEIFEPFFSTKSSQASIGGTGVGLWLCSQIIVQHHGTITAENVESGGARFAVRLPLADVEPHTHGSRQTSRSVD